MRRNLAHWWERQKFVDKVFICCAITLVAFILVSTVAG